MEQTARPAPLQSLRSQSIRAFCTDCTVKSAQRIWCLFPAGRTTALASEPSDNARTHPRVSVSVPFIAVVPACARVVLHGDDNPQGVVIGFDSNKLSEASRKAFGTTACEVPRWIKAWDPFLSEAADTLATLYARKRPDDVCLAAFAEVIALHLACRYGRDTGAQAPRTCLTQHRFAIVEHFIHEHIAENIQVEQLAALVHVSPSHFARAFKNTTGHPPHFFLTTERLKLARSLLAEGSLPLIDVATRAGFQTQQHFTEVFHRYTGSTPGAFRLAHKRH